MTDTVTVLATALLVGAFAGTDAAIWGMYKDAAHEGFDWPRFARSIVIGACAALLIQFVVRLPLPSPHAILLLFGLAYGTERLVVETWKSFFRTENQSKYTIPMQIAVRGVVVESKTRRWLSGIAYVALIAISIVVVQRWIGSGGARWQAGLLGAVVGFVIAVGGAWKDAPIEGFETLKFFRSPALAMIMALLLYSLGVGALLAALAAIGYERAISENYKTFGFPDRPRGKFAGKAIMHPEMLVRRRHFVPAYVGIRVALASCTVLAVTNPR